MNSQPTTPFVSVIIPVRNEERFIARTLDSVLRQDYPPGCFEVIVVDGMSEDATREIVSDYVQRDARVRIIDNPHRVTPNGLNAAIAVARGEILCRIDGHCEVAVDFVSQNVRLLDEHPEAWVVGGPTIHAGRGLRGKAAALAMSHPLGAGGARHRFPSYEGYADTVAFPAFRRWVFDRVGLFDETLIRTEDDELHYRVTQAGGLIFVSPRVRNVYHVRERLTELFRQHFQYSFWRIPVIRKHGTPTTFRQVVPILFFAAMSVLAGAGVWVRQPLLALALPGAYGTALLLFGASVAPRAGVRVASLMPATVMTVHVAYASGMAYGLLALIFRSRAWDRGGSMTALTR
jgi:glycosyltransferase involved in cell wall biosynthesis